MATEQVNIVVSATDNASGALKTLQSNVDKFRDSFSSTLQKAAPASQAFAAGVAGIAVAGAGMGYAMIKAASDIEQTQIAFTTMLGSAEKAQSFVAKMKEFARTTPLETSDIAQASQVLLSFGISADKVLPNLRMIGDVALGNQEKFKALSLAFAQVQSTGRLMGQDLLQMINVGFNPLQVISEQTGESMASLKDKMAAGAISADMVSEAFKIATSEGGRFFGGMAAQSHSLSGVISTLKDDFSQFLAAAGAGLAESLKGIILSFNEWVASMGGAQGILKRLNEVVDQVKANLPLIAGIIIGGVTPAFLVLGGAIITATAPLLPFIAAGAALGLVVQMIIDHFGGWQGTLQAIQPIIDGVRAVVMQFWQVFQGFLPTLQAVWSVLADALAPLLPLLAELFMQVWGVIQQLWQALMELWNLISPILIPVLEVLAGILGLALLGAILTVIAIIKVFITMLTAIVEAVKVVIKWFTDFISWLVKLRDQFMEFWKSVTATTQAAVDIVKAIVEAGFAFIQKIIDTFIGTAKGVWEGGWKAMESVVTGVWDSVKNATQTAVDFVMNAVNKIKSFMDSIKGAISSVSNAAMSAGAAVFGGKGFASGGIVGGPLGSAQLAVVHGGEQFIPAASMRSGGGSNGSGGGVVVNVSGNNIANDLDISNLAERVGDAVMRSLNSNLKF